MAHVSELEALLDYSFLVPRLAETALTHSSFAHEPAGKGREPNSRLAFLGDAVLGLEVRRFLYLTRPRDEEGDLTELAKAALNNEWLAELAATSLTKLLDRGRGQAQTADGIRIRAQLVEAVIGAVYLDRGLASAARVVEKLVLRPALAANRLPASAEPDKIAGTTPAELVRSYSEASTLQTGAYEARFKRVFGATLAMVRTPERALEWLGESNRLLVGRTPLACLASDEGAAEVEALIGRIQHGVY
ncbi:MAG: ribonuclease III domain-containing protein [Candidatus Thermoplasmatota archaeon]|jgi:dsRNA-specific ribonuclease